MCHCCVAAAESKSDRAAACERENVSETCEAQCHVKYMYNEQRIRALTYTYLAINQGFISVKFHLLFYGNFRILGSYDYLCGCLHVYISFFTCVLACVCGHKQCCTRLPCISHTYNTYNTHLQIYRQISHAELEIRQHDNLAEIRSFGELLASVAQHLPA